LTALRTRSFHTIKHLDARFYGPLVRAGLLPFALMMEGANQEDGSTTPMPRMDEALLTGLVDRWRSETHTFHLSFGEMTITLKDIAMLTGLPIRGRPVLFPSTCTSTMATISPSTVIEHYDALLFQNVLVRHILYIH
jgi:hypothetical protein